VISTRGRSGALPSVRSFWVRYLAFATLAGVGLGACARIAMRFVALESGGEGGFSLGGSLEVVAFGALIGIPIAIGFGWIRARVRMPPPWFGLATGILIFAVLATFPPPSARSALFDTPDTPLFTALTFAALFAAFGVVLEYGFRSLRWPKRPLETRT